MDRETEITDKLLQLMRVERINHNLDNECIKLRREIAKLEERDNGRVIEDLRKENSDLRVETYKLKEENRQMKSLLYIYDADTYFDLKKPRLSKVCRELDMDVERAINILTRAHLIPYSQRETFRKPNTKLTMMQYCVLRFMDHNGDEHHRE
jgi:hypothetical protein